MASGVRKLHAIEEREGKPGRRPIPEGVRLPPEAPPEPNWIEPFPEVILGTKPGRAPQTPTRPPKGASDEERTAYRLTRLGWLIELFAHHEELRAWEERKRLKAEAVRCRKVAAETWNALVPLLEAQGILALADAGAMKDHCVLQARLDQAERDITDRGVWVQGERGAQKNPSTTFANQCREKDRPYLQDFGLTPGARDKLNPRGGPDGEGTDLFDA